jgi:uncharacterized alkaline shock family protein YloU
VSRADTGPVTATAAPQDELGPAEERGRLVIAHTVVRKIAQYAADEVPGTTRARRSLAGVELGRQGASAKIFGNGNEVDVLIDLALHYPAAVRDVVDAVRTHVAEEIGRLTAYRVRALDVTVSALLPDVEPRVE